MQYDLNLYSKLFKDATTYYESTLNDIFVERASTLICRSLKE